MAGLDDLPLVRAWLRGPIESITIDDDELTVHIDAPEDPLDDESGIAIHDWSLGDELLVELDQRTSSIVGIQLAQGMDDDDQPGVLDLESLQVEAARELRVPFCLTDSASTAWNLRADGSTQVRLIVDGRDAATWHRVGEPGMVVGLDELGVLAQLVVEVAAITDQQQDHAIRIAPGTRAIVYQGLHVSVGLDDEEFDADVDADADSRSGAELADLDELDYAPLDAFITYGDSHVVLRADGVLAQLDALLVHEGLPIEEPPDAEVHDDGVDVLLRWPCAVEAFVRRDSDDAIVEVRFASGEPARWLEVQGLLVGVDDANRLVCLTDPQALLEEPGEPSELGEDAWLGDQDGFDGARHAAMVADSLDEQLEQVRQFADDPPWPVFAPVDQPDVPLSLEVEESMLGDGHVVAATLEWFDAPAWLEPGDDRPEDPRTMPRLEVETRVGEQVEGLEEALDDHARSDPAPRGTWLLGMTGHLDEEQSPATPREAELWFRRQREHAIALEAELDDCTIRIDGVDVPGTIIRRHDAFVATTQHAHAIITIRSANLGGTLPELVTATQADLYRALHGATRTRDAHVSMIARATMDENAPEPVAAARDEIERLAATLRRTSGDFEPPRPGEHPAGCFASDVVERHGGDAAFDARWSMYAQAWHDASAQLLAMDRDASVAHLAVTIQLPRPDGMMVAYMSVNAGDWWDHDAEEVRAAADERLDRDEMRRYEINLNALVARQDDGSWKLETDLLTLVDDAVGGLPGLLRMAVEPEG